MTALKNIKHETFCREVIKAAQTGKSQGDAYLAAGYQPSGNDHSPDVCASRLLKRVDVRDRITELTAPTLRKSRVSVESLLLELDQTISDARAAKQHSVVVNALTVSAKLVGLLRERVEVGPVGSFDGCQTVDEVLSLLLSDLAPAEALATLDELREQIERYAAGHAEVVAPRPPQPWRQAIGYSVPRGR